MAKQEISAVQIQMAAAAGVELLKVEDLVLANPEPAENITGGPEVPPIAPVETPEAPAAEEGSE
jgi:hypothetical protein